MVPRTHLNHATHKTPLVAERRAWFHHGSVVVPGTHLSHAAQKTLFNAIACRAAAWLRYGSAMAPQTRPNHAAHKTPLVAEGGAWLHHGSVVVPGTHLKHATQKTPLIDQHNTEKLTSSLETLEKLGIKYEEKFPPV